MSSTSTTATAGASSSGGAGDGGDPNDNRDDHLNDGHGSGGQPFTRGKGFWNSMKRIFRKKRKSATASNSARDSSVETANSSQSTKRWQSAGQLLDDGAPDSLLGGGMSSMTSPICSNDSSKRRLHGNFSLSHDALMVRSAHGGFPAVSTSRDSSAEPRGATASINTSTAGASTSAGGASTSNANGFAFASTSSLRDLNDDSLRNDIFRRLDQRRQMSSSEEENSDAGLPRSPKHRTLTTADVLAKLGRSNSRGRHSSTTCSDQSLISCSDESNRVSTRGSMESLALDDGVNRPPMPLNHAAALHRREVRPRAQKRNPSKAHRRFLADQWSKNMFNLPVTPEVNEDLYHSSSSQESLVASATGGATAASRHLPPIPEGLDGSGGGCRRPDLVPKSSPQRDVNIVGPQRQPAPPPVAAPLVNPGVFHHRPGQELEEGLEFPTPALRSRLAQTSAHNAHKLATLGRKHPEEASSNQRAVISPELDDVTHQGSASPSADRDVEEPIYESVESPEEPKTVKTMTLDSRGFLVLVDKPVLLAKSSQSQPDSVKSHGARPKPATNLQRNKSALSPRVQSPEDEKFVEHKKKLSKRKFSDPFGNCYEFSNALSSSNHSHQSSVDGSPVSDTTENYYEHLSQFNGSPQRQTRDYVSASTMPSARQTDAPPPLPYRPHSAFPDQGGSPVHHMVHRGSPPRLNTVFNSPEPVNHYETISGGSPDANPSPTHASFGLPPSGAALSGIRKPMDAGGQQNSRWNQNESNELASILARRRALEEQRAGGSLTPPTNRNLMTTSAPAESRGSFEVQLKADRMSQSVYDAPKRTMRPETQHPDSDETDSLSADDMRGTNRSTSSTAFSGSSLPRSGNSPSMTSSHQQPSTISTVSEDMDSDETGEALSTVDRVRHQHRKSRRGVSDPRLNGSRDSGVVMLGSDEVSSNGSVHSPVLKSNASPRSQSSCAVRVPSLKAEDSSAEDSEGRGSNDNPPAWVLRAKESRRMRKERTEQHTSTGRLTAMTCSTATQEAKTDLKDKTAKRQSKVLELVSNFQNMQNTL